MKSVLKIKRNGKVKKVISSANLQDAQALERLCPYRSNSTKTIGTSWATYTIYYEASITDASYVTISNCDISYMGGGDQSGSGSSTHVRYGNGINIWESVNNITVENCHIWQIYDVAIIKSNWR